MEEKPLKREGEKMESGFMEAIFIARKNNFAVFPVEGKIPKFKDWQHFGTSFEECWNKWDTQPGGNIAVICGKASLPGLTVIDIDVAKEEDIKKGFTNAMIWYEELLKKHNDGKPINTLTVRTGGGGMHLYFKWCSKLKSKSKINNITVDVKTGDGDETTKEKEGRGYVVYPPSIHPDTGKRYQFENTSPMIDIPDWLLEALLAPKKDDDDVPTFTPKSRMTIDISALDKLISALDIRRAADKYDDYMHIVFAIKNLTKGEEGGYVVAKKFWQRGIDENTRRGHLHSWQKRGVNDLDTKWQEPMRDDNQPCLGLTRLISFLEEDIGRDECKKFMKENNIGYICINDPIKSNVDDDIAEYFCSLSHDVVQSPDELYLFDNKEKLWKVSREEFIRNHICLTIVSNVECIVIPPIRKNEGLENERIRELVRKYESVISKVKSYTSLLHITKMVITKCYDEQFEKRVNANPDLLPIRMGGKHCVINLRTREVRERNRDDIFSCELNCEYKPEIGTAFADRFFGDLFLDNAEKIEYIQRILGYCMTGYIKEQKFFIFCGDGSNGKSKLIEFLHNVVAGMYTPVSKGVFIKMGRRSPEAHTSFLMNIARKRIAVCSEVENGDVFQEDFVKRFTGDEELVVRGCYGKNETSIKNIAKGIVLTNEKPGCTTDSSWWRRAIVIPFDTLFVNNPKDLARERKLNADLGIELIKEENKSMFLNWLLMGATRWYNDPLDHKPAIFQEALQEYRHMNDPIQQFLEEHVVEDDIETVKLQKMHEEYVSFCQGNRVEHLGKIKFKAEMVRRGFTVSDSKKHEAVSFKNVRLVNVATQ